MSNKVTNVIIAGLGGQGILKASDILAEAAFMNGYEVKKAEIHGMSQRGGSVTSDVRFGEKIYSPTVPQGEADYLVVFDSGEVEVNRRYLGNAGMLIDPDLIKSEELPHKRALNIALLGILSAYLLIPEENWLAAIRSTLKSKLHEVNEKAFVLGRKIGLELRQSGADETKPE